MSKKKRRKNQSKNTVSQNSVTASLVQDAIQKDKSQLAVDLAKKYVKENPDQSDGESLLAQAYQLRIKKLLEAGLVDEAKSLVDTAKSKCPNHIHMFNDIRRRTYHFPLTPDEVEDIVVTLSTSESNEQTQHLSKLLGEGLSNPAFIADCSKLPNDHPLKKEALVVQKAFEAVTGNHSEFEQRQNLQQLSSVSRKSPLANWCLFIRALDAYHQQNDQLCIELLSRIPEHTTLAQVKSILQSKINHVTKPDGLSSRPTRELWKALTPESRDKQLQDIVDVIQKGQTRVLKTRIEQLFQSHWVNTPFLKREAARFIFQRLVYEDVFDQSVLKILAEKMREAHKTRGELYYNLTFFDSTGRMIPSGAFFYLNLILKELGELLNAKESALIYARAGKFAQLMEEEDQIDPFPFFMRKKKKVVDHSESIQFYQKARRFHPLPEYFAPLISLMEEDGRSTKEIEEVLHEWSDANPTDCTPLIHLFEKAEERNALQKALKFLEQAENIDPLNTKVREARQRLVWRNIQKHLKQKKAHLVEKDLQQIELSDLPPHKQALFQGIYPLLDIIRNNKSPDTIGPLSVHDTILLYHLNFSLELNLYNLLKQIAPIPALDTQEKLETYYNLLNVLSYVGESIFLISSLNIGSTPCASL